MQVLRTTHEDCSAIPGVVRARHRACAAGSSGAKYVRHVRSPDYGRDVHPGETELELILHEEAGAFAVYMKEPDVGASGVIYIELLNAVLSMSDEGAFITGACLEVHGGRFI
jgi:hypothetical protein